VDKNAKHKESNNINNRAPHAQLTTAMWGFFSHRFFLLVVKYITLARYETCSVQTAD